MSSYKSLISKGKVYWVSLSNGDKLLFRIVSVGDDYFRGLPLIPSEPSRHAGDARSIPFSAIVSLEKAGPPWSYYAEGGMYEKKAGAEKAGGCFIATAVYGSPDAFEVQTFRAFRDRYLASTEFGRKIIASYYEYSPFLAEVVRTNRPLRCTLWIVLTPVSRIMAMFRRFQQSRSSRVADNIR